MGKMNTAPMFSAIASRYDLCNHLFSFGLDFYWRKKTAHLCCNKPIDAALDLCCGTGDMAFALAKTGRVKTITASDISQPMLDLAQHKYAKLKNRGQLPVLNRVAPTSVASRRPVPTEGGSIAKMEACGCFSSVQINWLQCDAQNTGLPDASFDLITCAFGLRNVDDVPQTLKETHRLLKPGGKVCILEFSLPQNKFIRGMYSFYLTRIMPLAAQLIAGNSDPWHYLARSIGQWEKINLPEYLGQAGFCDVAIHPLTFSTVQITIAQKAV